MKKIGYFVEMIYNKKQLRVSLNNMRCVRGLNSLTKNEERAIKSLKKVLSDNFNLIELRLFGSKVRGEATVESDIDVMIEIDECNSDVKSQIYDIVFEINLKNDTFISTTIFNKKELENGPMSESPIYKVIQKEGVLL